MSTSTQIKSLKAELMEKDKIISALLKRVEKKNEKRLNSVEGNLIQLKSELFVSQTVSKRLAKQIANQEQYSRRNCILIEGLKIKEKETSNDIEKAVKTFLKDEVKINEDIFTKEFDKAHRVGKIKNGKQSTILRLNSHSLIEKIHKKKKDVKKRGYDLRPSLTRTRMEILQEARETVEKEDRIQFVFADIHGNLKVRLKDEFKKRFVFNFDDIEDLSLFLRKISQVESDHFDETF